LLTCYGCYSTCDCDDECDRSIPISFSTDSSSNGFRVSEIDTIKLYKLAKGQSVATDSIEMFLDPVYERFYSNTYGSQFCGANFGFSFDEMDPFLGSNYQNFDYLIKIPHLKTYRISDIIVEGKMSGGNCSCYSNKKKFIKVDGVLFDLSGKAYPDPVRLTK
jgi:hypothetical protein